MGTCDWGLGTGGLGLWTGDLAWDLGLRGGLSKILALGIKTAQVFFSHF